MKLYPDPTFAASLFAEGRLDTAFCRVIVPAATEVGVDPGSGDYLWLMRYGLRGDHWKIRFHGEKTAAEAFRAAVEHHAATYFEALPDEPEDAKRITSAVPIDAEESGPGGDEKQPHGLQTIGYRRSHVGLGSAVLHRQDAYCAAFTRALSHGTAALIEGVDPENDSEWSHGARFSFLLKILADGLAELELGAEAAQAYISYHRDTLLRSTDKEDAEAIADGKALFDRRLAKMADGGARLVDFVKSRFAGVRGATGTKSPAGLWRGGLARGLAEIEPLVAASAEDINTYADNPLFLPIFKLFQSTSNQIGLNVIEEAYVHHILLRAVSAGEVSS